MAQPCSGDADLAGKLGMAESSVKRMLVKGDMSLSRTDAICRALKLDFADVARGLADQKLGEKDREGYTLLLAMRSWEFEAFAALRR